MLSLICQLFIPFDDSCGPIYLVENVSQTQQVYYVSSYWRYKFLKLLVQLDKQPWQLFPSFRAPLLL
jgi:hypothetical protein